MVDHADYVLRCRLPSLGYRGAYRVAMVNRCAAPEVAEHLFTAAAAVVVRHHSKLDSGRDDAIIIGASSIAHLQHNLSAVKQDPLPRPVVDAINSASETVRPQWPSYFFEL